MSRMNRHQSREGAGPALGKRVPAVAQVRRGKKIQGGGIQPPALSREAGIQLHLSPLGMMAWLRPAPTNTYLALDKGEGDGQAGDYSGRRGVK